MARGSAGAERERYRFSWRIMAPMMFE